MQLLLRVSQKTSLMQITVLFRLSEEKPGIPLRFLNGNVFTPLFSTRKLIGSTFYSFDDCNEQNKYTHSFFTTIPHSFRLFPPAVSIALYVAAGRSHCDFY